LKLPRKFRLVMALGDSFASHSRTQFAHSSHKNMSIEYKHVKN